MAYTALHGAAPVVDRSGWVSLAFRAAVHDRRRCVSYRCFVELGILCDEASGKVELRFVHRCNLTLCTIIVDGMTSVATDCYGALVVRRLFELPRTASRHSIASSCAEGADKEHRAVSVPGVCPAQVGRAVQVL